MSTIRTESGNGMLSESNLKSAGMGGKSGGTE